MKPIPSRGFTWIEVLVAGVVVMAGALMCLNFLVSNHITTRKMMGTLCNMKLLHLATQQAAIDNATTGNLNQWTCSGTTPLSFDQWHKHLVPEYLSEKDFQFRISAQRIGKNIMPDALTVFAVCDSDSPTTVLFATKNWHGINAPKLSGGPFERHGFVLMRKSGEGAILRETDATNTSKIGSGGMHDFLPLK